MYFNLKNNLEKISGTLLKPNGIALNAMDNSCYFSPQGTEKLKATKTFQPKKPCLLSHSEMANKTT